jgi:hypothetical protein
MQSMTLSMLLVSEQLPRGQAKLCFVDDRFAQAHGQLEGARDAVPRASRHANVTPQPKEAEDFARNRENVTSRVIHNLNALDIPATWRRVERPNGAD